MLQRYEGNFSGDTGQSYMQIIVEKMHGMSNHPSQWLKKTVLPPTTIMRMTIFHHQEKIDLNWKTKPRKLLKTFHHGNRMIALMKQYPMIWA